MIVLVKLVLLFALFNYSFDVTRAQSNGGSAIELKDFDKHVSLNQSVYSFYDKTCCDITQANSTCNKFGGFLALVKTQQVWELIKANINERTGGGLFNHMLWIGLHRVVDNRDVWEWFDGTPLEGERNNQNWYKETTDEPNNSGGNEDCVGVATQDVRLRRPGGLGKWGDIKCEREQRFICENHFGSGFVDRFQAIVNDLQSTKIICTVFGNTSVDVIWYRNGKSIPSNTNERIYQQIDEKTEYRTSTITFANPLESDEGNYICLLRNIITRSSKYLTVQLDTNKFLSDPTTGNQISGTQNITCTARGRPIPKITWKIGDVELETNDQIFQVFNTINENTLTSESVFSIINPISFEKDTQLSCVVEGQTESEDMKKKVLTMPVNDKFSDFSGSRYKVNGIMSQDQCNNFKGIFTDEPKQCYVKAAEMMETEEEKCEGSELSIQIRDFTETATSYNLNVTRNGIFIDQHLAGNPWNEGKITIRGLQPRENYTLKLTYKPKYWRKSVILTKPFQTKGKIPEVMDIIRANITTDNKCEVEFRPPSNIKTSQLQTLEVKITEIGENQQQTQTNISTKYNKDMNTFQFETNKKQASYMFKVRLITCAGDVGDESESFECFRDVVPSNSGIIGGITGGLIVIIIIIIVAILLYRRNKLKVPEKQNINTEVKNETSPDIQTQQEVTYENVRQISEVPTTTPHGINIRSLLETYKFLMASDKQGFKTQFQKLKSEIKAKNFSTVISHMEENSSKNRYKNIVPYDETRVVLSTDDGSSDYINACWINGYKHKRRFVATQGPKPASIDDFWRMIYETDCKVIVMLTNLIEGGKRKCEQYWPDRGNPYKSAKFVIKFVTEDLAAAYISRTFTIARTSAPKELRIVTQYQFICWPDHGVPDITSPILRFYNEVMEFANSSENKSTPVVVHCSAGVGRTGTFISLDILNEMLNNEDYVDIYQTVFDLRLQRMDMVQTVDQFAFLHKLVVETYLLGNTDYTFEEFLKLRFDKHKYMESIRKDFSRLSTIPVTDDSQTLAYGRDLDHFNRDPNILPYNRTRVICSQTTQQTDDVYFNGSWIKNFRDGRKVISAQTPIPSTIETFLNIIAENSVSVVVMISEKGEECLYWPTNGTSARFGEVVVQNTSEIVDQNSTTRKLKVFSAAPNPKNIKVHQIVVESWKDTDLSDDESDLLCSKINKLIQQIDAEWNDNSTILIHCKDGSSFCGSLCALLQVNERLKMENKVDLFRVVKDLRDMRPQMVRTLGQYDICHQVTESFIQSLQTYANF